MKYNKLTVHEQFTENPFIEQASEVIKVSQRTQRIRPKNSDAVCAIMSTEGEVEGYTAFVRFVEVDEEKFTKVYLSNFSAFWELSRPAIKVFGYIMTVLQPKKDKFTFKMDMCLEHTGYKHKKEIFSGLSDLANKSIIARSKYDWEYFINPLVAFNGDRVTFTKMYVKKRKEENKKADQKQLDLFDSNINAFETKPDQKKLTAEK